MFGVQRPAVVDARWNMLHPRDSKGRFTRSFTRVLKPADNRLARKIIAAFSGRSFTSPAARKGFFASFGGPDGASTTRRAFASGELKSAHRAVRTEKAAVDSPIVRAIDAEMRPLPHDIEVHRRVNQARFGQVPVEELEGYKVKDAGWVFATLGPDPDPTGIHMRIKVPAGVRGVVLDEERGLLALDRELEMAITSVEPNGRGGFDMDMVVLHRAKRGEQTGGAEQDRTERTAADDGDGDGEDQPELPLEPTPAVGAEDDSTPAAPPQPGTPEPPFVAEPVPNPVMPRAETPDERVRFVDDPELAAFRQPLTTPGDMREYRAAPHLWVRIHRDGDTFEVSDRGVWGNTDPDSVARFGSEDDARREVAFRMAEAQGGDLPAGERPERLGDEPAEPTADERIAELRGLDPGMVPGYVQALKGARLTAVARALKVNRGRVADKRAAIVASVSPATPQPSASSPNDDSEDAQAVPPVKWSHETRSLESGLENDPERDEISAALRDWVYDKASSEAIIQGRGDQVDAANAAEPYVNAALRGRADMTPGRARSIGLLDKAFDASRIDRPITVYRGYSDGAGILPDDWLDRDLAGLEWDNTGFTATTVDRDGAETYAGVEEDRGFAVRLHLPEGFPAIAIRDEPGGLDDEGEIILPRDLQFRVVADGGVQGDYGVRWLDVEATEKPRAPLVVAGESQQDGSEEPVVDDPLEQARHEARRTPTAAGHRENLAGVGSRQEAVAYVGALDGQQLDGLLSAVGAEPRGSVDEKRQAAVEATVGRRFPVVEEPAPAAAGGPAGQTRPLSPADRLVATDLADADRRRGEIEAGLGHVFGGEYGDLRVEPDEANVEAGFSAISGQILDVDGRRVGYVERAIAVDGNRLVAVHSRLQLEPEVQGQGFANAYNAALEGWYRASGITEIRLTANADVGGYAWARAGYDWANEQQANNILGRLRTLLNVGSDRLGGDREQQMAVARALLARAGASTYGDPDYPSPYEISQAGRWSGAGKDDTWAGKWALLGTSWDAVKPLTSGGEPPEQRRFDELGDWHHEWVDGALPSALDSWSWGDRPDETVYGQHHVDLDATPEDQDQFVERADEIMGVERPGWLDDDNGPAAEPVAAEPAAALSSADAVETPGAAASDADGDESVLDPRTTTAKVPADLDDVDDDALIALLVDPDVAGDADQVGRVWAELSRREENEAAEAARLPELPADLTERGDDYLLADLVTYGADERTVRRVWAELTRREEAETARVEQERQAEAARLAEAREAAEAEVRRKAAAAEIAAREADAEVARWRSWPLEDLRREHINLMFGHGGDPIVRDRLAVEIRRREQAQQEADLAANNARVQHRYAVVAVEDLSAEDLRAAEQWLTRMAGREGDDRKPVKVGGFGVSAAELDEMIPGRLVEVRARLADVDRAEAETKARREAGPVGPARYRNPLDEWRFIEQMISGYGDQRDARDRAGEAKRRTLGLPVDATDKDVKAAERADPRSPAQRAAWYAGWYRHLAAADGVPGDQQWKTGKPDDDAVSASTRPAVPPVNVAKAWDLWQDIRRQAKADRDAGDDSTWRRYVAAMRRTYEMPDDGPDAEVSGAFRADGRTQQQIAADFLGQYRELAREQGIDPNDQLRFGPPDRKPSGRMIQWAASTPEQHKAIDALLARGFDYLDAYAQVHDVDSELLRTEAAAGVVDRRAKERIIDAVRRQYDEWLHLRYIEAETAVRGHMLSPAGKAAVTAGRLGDAIALFSGSDVRARKYASEDLRRWWEENGGRLTYVQFKAQLLRRRRDIAAAKVDASAGQGEDFG